MSAPERIFMSDPDAEGEVAVWFEPDEGGTEYVRADLHDALRAERDALAARVERLEGALRDLEKRANEVSRKGAVTGPQWIGLTSSILRARAALSTAQEPTAPATLDTPPDTPGPAGSARR